MPASEQLSVPDQCRRLAIACQNLGSALYSHLLLCCADDYEKGGPMRELLKGHERDTEGSALPLRLMGSFHRLVLEGLAPELARFYPSAGGTAKPEGACEVLSATAQIHFDALRSLLENPCCQTNEVGRSACLLGGFGLVAGETHLPLRLLEIGASAGLNLRWDRYHYEWPGGSWGDPSSSVRLANIFADRAPRLPSKIPIVDRAGCDPSPVDVNSHAGRLTLLSYTWADQMDRIGRLEAAIKIARAVPYAIEKAYGADWLEARLRKPVLGAATVIFHSVVWQYISEIEQQRIIAIIEDAGNKASPNAPVAWLRMEPTNDVYEIRLKISPGFEDQIVAIAHPHAPSVQWLWK